MASTGDNVEASASKRRKTEKESETNDEDDSGSEEVLNLSMNRNATVECLKRGEYIKPTLKVLNLAGIPDLDFTTLKDAIKDLKNLTDLDVSFTKLGMSNFLDIVKIRPTLKSIDINFDVTKKKSKKDLLEYQKAFENFENVHFAAGPKKFDVKTAVEMLQKATLTNFKITCYGGEDFKFNLFDANMEMVNFSQFQFYYLVHSSEFISTAECPIFELMDFTKYEALIIQKQYDLCRTLYATPLIKNLINEQFPVDINELSDPMLLSDIYDKLKIRTDTEHECLTIFWDKNRVDFKAEEFNTKLVDIFKDHYIFTITSDELTTVKIPDYKFYNITQYIPEEYPKEKKCFELDYGTAFKEKDKIRLSINFRTDYHHFSVKFVNDSNFLKKITHLYLRGHQKCDAEFLRPVFEYCESLITLQIIQPDDTLDSTALKYIGTRSSLKNIYIQCGHLPFADIFKYLRKCVSLENIVLIGNLRTPLPSDPPELISECTSLYNFCIQMYKLDKNECKDLLSLYNRYKLKHCNRKRRLRIAMGAFDSTEGLVYDIFLSKFFVFELMST